MYNIEYGIELNEEGRPCIFLPDEYEHKPEDRFFALEIANYVLQDTFRRATNRLDQETIDKLRTTIGSISSISDEIASIIRGMMEANGTVHSLMNRYSLTVDSVDQLYNLSFDEIVYDSMVFRRSEGLRVLVSDGEVIMELKGGIENENWVKV